MALLDYLKANIAVKRAHSSYENQKVLFYQNNTSCHMLMVTMSKLHELYFKLLPHP